MKKTLMVSLLIALNFIYISSVNAQDPKTKEERIERRVQKLDKELNLNENQETALKQLFISHSENRDAAHKEAKQNRANMQAEIQKILSPEQFTKYQAIESAKHEKMKSKHDAAKMGNIQKELNLTDAQVATLSPIMSTHKNNVSEIKKSSDGSNSDDLKTKLKQEHKRYKEDLKTVLSADQIKKLQEMSKNKRAK